MMNLSVVIDLTTVAVSFGAIAFITAAYLRFMRVKPEAVRVIVKKENRDELR